MKLNRLYIKTMLVVLVLGVVISSSTLFKSIVDRQNLTHLAQSYKIERQTTFKANLDSSLDLNRIFTRDYSIWDEMIKAIKNNDDTWFFENINSALDTYKVSAAWVVDRDYNLKYTAVNADQNKDYPLPINFKTNIKELFKNGYFVETFTTFDDKLYHISIAPIQPTEDFNRKSTPQGFFITAKQLNGDFINQLESINQVDVRSIGSDEIKNKDDLSSGVVNFEYIFRDLRGMKVGQYIIEAQSDFLKSLYQDQLNNHWLFVIGLFAIISTFGIIIYFLVSAPLRDVSDAIKYGGGVHLEKIIKRKDEIGDIARLVQGNIHQNEQVKASLASVKRAEEDASKRLAEVQQLNDLMVDRELRMVELKKENRNLKEKLNIEGITHNDTL